MLSKRAQFFLERSKTREKTRRSPKKIPEELLNDEDFIKLNVTESIIMSDVFKEKLDEFLRSEPGIAPKTLRYADHIGPLDSRKVFIELMKKFVFHSQDESFSYEHMCIYNGSISTIEMLGYCICEEGGSIVIPSPYYHGFPEYLGDRLPTKVVGAPKKFVDGQYVLDLTTVAEKCKLPGVNGVLIANPDNPLGTLLSLDEISQLIDIVLENDQHLIMDENFANSMFTDSKVEFRSVYDLILSESNPEKKRKMEQSIHVVYSLSKDFGISGFRVGFAYTRNAQFRAVFEKIGFHQHPSTLTCAISNAIFQDHDWVEGYITENRKRLQQRWEVVTEKFDEQGVHYTTAVSGMWLWFHLEFLETWEEEEEFLDMLITEKKVNITRGHYLEAPQPGWFRLVSTCEPEDVVLEAIRRIFELVDMWKLKKVLEKKKKKEIKVDLKIHLRDSEKNEVLSVELNDFSVLKAYKLIQNVIKKEEKEK